MREYYQSQGAQLHHHYCHYNHRRDGQTELAFPAYRFFDAPSTQVQQLLMSERDLNRTMQLIHVQ